MRPAAPGSAANAAMPARQGRMRGLIGRKGLTLRAHMSSVGMRLVASAAGVAALLFSTFLASAHEPKAGNQRQPSAEAENAKKVDEIAEAARQLDGPAGQPECV